MKELFYHQFDIIKKGITNLIFPPFCLLCGDELKKNERLICEDCFAQIQTIESPFCRKCGAPLEKDIKTCVHCEGMGFHFLRVRALGSFTSPLSEMVHLLKYERKTHLANRLGILLGNILVADSMLNDADFIIPVPLHKAKLRERGYNQSLLLARKVSSIAHKELYMNAVIRKKATKSQTSLGHKERRENLRNAFSVISPERIRYRKVVVVDDVLTTGTTLDEMAKTLLEAGAESVYGLILARALSV